MVTLKNVKLKKKFVGLAKDVSTEPLISVN